MAPSKVMLLLGLAIVAVVLVSSDAASARGLAEETLKTDGYHHEYGHGHHEHGEYGHGHHGGHHGHYEKDGRGEYNGDGHGHWGGHGGHGHGGHGHGVSDETGN